MSLRIPTEAVTDSVHRGGNYERRKKTNCKAEEEDDEVRIELRELVSQKR